MNDDFFDALKGFVWGLAACALAWLLVGCSAHRTVTGETRYKTDTVYVANAARDTVRTLDSVWVETYTKGDTVWRDKTVTRWRERVSLRTDTIYKSALQRDTVRVPVPVERKATWWERNITEPLQNIIGCAMGLVIVAAVARWLARKKRK